MNSGDFPGVIVPAAESEPGRVTRAELLFSGNADLAYYAADLTALVGAAPH